jgi:hypothetical protein
MDSTDQKIKAFKDDLKTNHAGALVLTTGETISYGVIRVLADTNKLVFYTKEGLTTLWPKTSDSNTSKDIEALRNLPDEELEQRGYIRTISLDEISTILF